MLKRLQRRHTLMEEEEVKEDQPKRTYRTSSLGSYNPAMDLESNLKRAESCAAVGRRSSSSNASTVVITESELVSSRLYKNRKAARINSEGGTLIDNKPHESVLKEDEDLKPVPVLDPRMKPLPVRMKQHPENTSSCCCYFAMIVLICLITLGIIAAIGGVVYMEFFAVRKNHVVLNAEKQLENDMSFKTAKKLDSDTEIQRKIPDKNTNLGDSEAVTSRFDVQSRNGIVSPFDKVEEDKETIESNIGGDLFKDIVRGIAPPKSFFDLTKSVVGVAQNLASQITIRESFKELRDTIGDGAEKIASEPSTPGPLSELRKVIADVAENITSERSSPGQLSRLKKIVEVAENIPPFSGNLFRGLNPFLENFETDNSKTKDENHHPAKDQSTDSNANTDVDEDVPDPGTAVSQPELLVSNVQNFINRAFLGRGSFLLGRDRFAEDRTDIELDSEKHLPREADFGIKTPEYGDSEIPFEIVDQGLEGALEVEDHEPETDFEIEDHEPEKNFETEDDERLTDFETEDHQPESEIDFETEDHEQETDFETEDLKQETDLGLRHQDRVAESVFEMDTKSQQDGFISDKVPLNRPVEAGPVTMPMGFLNRLGFVPNNEQSLTLKSLDRSLSGFLKQLQSLDVEDILPTPRAKSTTFKPDRNVGFKPKVEEDPGSERREYLHNLRMKIFD